MDLGGAAFFRFKQPLSTTLRLLTDRFRRVGADPQGGGGQGGGKPPPNTWSDTPDRGSADFRVSIGRVNACFWHPFSIQNLYHLTTSPFEPT